MLVGAWQCSVLMGAWQMVYEILLQDCVRENDEHDLGQLVYHLTQWVTGKLVAASGSGSSDSLCTATFSLLAVLLPNFPVQYHHVYLQFICTALLKSSSNIVSWCKGFCMLFYLFDGRNLC